MCVYIYTYTYAMKLLALCVYIICMSVHVCMCVCVCRWMSHATSAPGGAAMQLCVLCLRVACL